MIDQTTLQNVKVKSGYITAKCPACAETECDKKGNHLIVYDSGKFACVQHQGKAGGEHRKRIFALVGVSSGLKLPPKMFAVTTTNLKIHKKSVLNEENYNLGREGRFFSYSQEVPSKFSINIFKKVETPVPAVPNGTKGDCHTTPAKSIDETDWPQPYIDKNGTLVIPLNSEPKYHWWNGGQSIRGTLRELGASDDILKKYKSPYSNN